MKYFYYWSMVPLLVNLRLCFRYFVTCTKFLKELLYIYVFVSDLVLRCDAKYAPMFWNVARGGAGVLPGGEGAVRHHLLLLWVLQGLQVPRPFRLSALCAGETLSAVTGSYQCFGSVSNSVGCVTNLNLGGILITYGTVSGQIRIHSFVTIEKNMLSNRYRYLVNR